MPAKVSHHAVRRYAERAMNQAVDEAINDREAMAVLEDRGISVAGITARLHRLCDQAADLGAIAVKGDNVRILLKRDIIVTVLPKHSVAYSNGETRYAC